VRASDYTTQEWLKTAPLWESVYSAASNPSFFLRRDWVETWLEVFGNQLRVRFLVFERDGAVAGICLLVDQVSRHGPIRTRQLYLNTAGEPSGQSVSVEFNALLCRSGMEADMAVALAGFIAREPWDEFLVNGMTESAFGDVSAATRGLADPDPTWSVDYYVDLARLRAEKRDYVAALSKNTRDQIRRSSRLYAGGGAVEVTPAKDDDQALAMLDELASLHQAAWTERGKPGAFSSEQFRAFHDKLIRRTFAKNLVQLLRVSAAGETVGILYFFIHGTLVHFYQSGLTYRDDNRYKPGVVSHAAAIQYWSDQGMDAYDFMAGDPGEIRYKKSLGTDSRQLGWITFERRNLKMYSIKGIRALKRSLAAFTKRRTIAPVILEG
jgi:hypothetical protein